jgi:hypothetical protein
MLNITGFLPHKEILAAQWPFITYSMEKKLS